MARKLGRGEQRDEPSFDPIKQTESNTSEASSSLDRRTYLRATVATVATLGGASGLASIGAAEGGGYETIELAAGEQRAYEISDGETFENVLIDQTAPGSMFALIMEPGANDWAIRNVGWKGVAPTGSGNRDWTFLINVRGNGVIENVFIDQRSHDGGEGSDVGGIWTYSDSHHGHIECRHNFIAGCGNNGSYTSGDGWSHYDARGTVEHYRSYHRDNTVSNFRPGNPGCTVRECVSVINDPAGTRGSYPATTSQMSRACWAWHHPEMYMEDCAIWQDPDDVSPAAPFWATWRSGSAGDLAELHVIDCHINPSWQAEGNSVVPTNHGGDASDRRTVHVEGLGTDPDVSILGDGVPTTPEMAAAGERNLPPALGTAPSGGLGDFREPEGEGGEDAPEWTYTQADGVHTELPYELVIEHVQPGARVDYEIEFGGNVEAGEWEYNATIVDNVASGGVGPSYGLDNLYFDGDIIRFTVQNAAHADFYLANAQEREIITRIEPEPILFSRAQRTSGQTEPHTGDRTTNVHWYDQDRRGGEDTSTGPSLTPPDGDSQGSRLVNLGIAGAVASLGALGYTAIRRFGGQD